MPCYQVRTMSVEFHAKNRGLLERAITALGWSMYVEGDIMWVTPTNGVGFSLDLKRGQAVIRSREQADLNTLKQQYSKEAIKRAASANEWNISWDTNDPQKIQGALRRW